MSKKGTSATSDYLNFDSTLNKAIKILKKEKNYKLGFLIVVGINSGLRISDLLQLEFSDFETDSILLIEKKTKKKRTIKINDNIKEAFKLLKLRTNIREGHVFLSNQNSVYSTQYINRKLKDILGSKKLLVSSHSLRKTFGRQVWKTNGENEKALLFLSELFNHSSPAITKRYLGIRQQELDDIYLNL